MPTIAASKNFSSDLPIGEHGVLNGRNRNLYLALQPLQIYEVLKRQTADAISVRREPLWQIQRSDDV